MENKKKNRKALRSNFTKFANEFDQLLTQELADSQSLLICWDMLQEKYESLRVIDKEIYDSLLGLDVSEEDLVSEMDSCDNYSRRFSTLKISFNSRHKQSVSTTPANTRSMLTPDSDIKDNTCKRNFKLPRIEFKKFSGDIREWLSFWNQFKKVHDDPDIDLADKVEYLIQATLPNSRARQLVESFPAMGENYTKIVESLKSRFGREELQIEVYVRELLKLVLNNSRSENKMDLSLLYDKIETQLRALESLGITTDKCAAMLFPLIESCLPEELIRIWQRSSFNTSHIGNTRVGERSEILCLKARLDNLISFLKNEVDNEQRISLATEGFGLCSVSEQTNVKSGNNRYKTKIGNPVIPTATGLVNFEIGKCVFCQGTHDSIKCFKVQKLNLEEKRSKLAQAIACFRCLKIGHSAKRCRDRTRCIICTKSHVTLMCPDLPKHKETTATETALTNCSSCHVFLQTLKIFVEGKHGLKEIRALIDTGSQRSYILKSTVQFLSCQPKRTQKLVHSLFGGTTTTEQEHNCYSLTLRKGDYSCVVEVLDQRTICNDITPIFYGPWLEELEHMNIILSDIQSSAPVELLIGADIAGKLYTGQKHNLSCGLVAIETLFGWTLMGKVPVTIGYSSTTMTVISLLTNDVSLANLWELDVLGIANPTDKKFQIGKGLETKQFFLETVSVNKDGRYQIRLPWMDGHPPLPNNYFLAKKRLESCLKKLKDGRLVDAYDAVFQEWLDEDIIEEVSNGSPTIDCHYLPHRPVIKESSATTKIRPVFDASAHEKNKPSLNHCLEKGLNLIELIPKLLIQFREYEIGVVSDIRKAFLQISIHETDRDFLRFLWIDSEGHEKTYRHQRVVFGVNCSPFLLGATIEYHLSQSLKKCDIPGARYSKEIVKKLGKSFYVDNCVTSVPDRKTLIDFIRESSMVMADGMFDLRGWESTGIKNDESSVSVLGLVWMMKSDTLAVSEACIKNNVQDSVLTKRLILSIAQKVFDPIGFACPVTLFPKLLLQRTWTLKLGWDSPVDKDTERSFSEWVRDLPNLVSIKIPRWIGRNPQQNSSDCSLHIFCDASKDAYSAVVFIRVSQDSNVSVHLLAAKSRVSPIKKLSIPRLELLAATIGARLYSYVQESFEVKMNSFFWTDSSTVISWIRRKEEWATFVWNRIEEIRVLTPMESWRHIPGSLNPADLPSRGCTAKYLLESKWWEGPHWLHLEPCEWPTELLQYDEEEIQNEKKKKVVTTLLSHTGDYWHILYFSKYTKIVRLIAWIQRFVYNLRYPPRKVGVFTVEDLKNAEMFLLKGVQEEVFGDEKNERIISLQPFKDELGLLRLKTKVSNRADTEDFRFPILLPAKHHVVNCLVMYTHQNSCHVGPQGLISILRERYWILGGRRYICSVLNHCMICKKQKVRQFEVETPPLPSNRVCDAVPFQIIGIDFAGPLYLRTGVKAWISIFTCAVYRAIHVELTTSLSTLNFIQVLRRFISRRGRPKIIYSDNATNFVGAENAFNDLDWQKVIEYASIERIKWYFNPPAAPWWGGFWESMIGVLKRLLRKVLGRASLDYEDLLTLICECEAIVNARPLTYVSNDPNELIALTPAMFLREQTEVDTIDCDLVDENSLCKKIRHKQKLRNDLRRRFRNEYLGQLKAFYKKKSSKPVALGDIVLVGDDNKKRLDWPLGRIVKLLRGKDDLTRVVQVKTAKGILLRPVQRLFPLECGEYEGSKMESVVGAADLSRVPPKIVWK